MARSLIELLITARYDAKKQLDTLKTNLKEVSDRTLGLASESERYSFAFSKGLTNVVKKTNEFKSSIINSQEAINKAFQTGTLKIEQVYEKAYRQIEQAKIRSLRAEEKAVQSYEKFEESVFQRLKQKSAELNSFRLSGTKATIAAIEKKEQEYKTFSEKLGKQKIELQKEVERKKLKISYDYFKKLGEITLAAKEKGDKILNEEVDRMGKAAKKSQTAFLDAADNIGNGLTSIGRTMAIVGAAMEAVLFIPVKFAYDVEKAMGVVRAVTRALPDDMARLNEKVKELGRETIFTATQAAEGMQDLARAGFTTTEIIGAMRNVLDLAASAQLSVAESAKISANIMRGYSLTIKDLADVNDVLVTAFTKSTTNLSELGVAFRYAGPLARAAGYDIKETGAVLAAFANVGQQGTIAGTALRNALTRLANPTKAATAVLKSLGITVVDDDGRLKSFVDIVKSFEIGLSNVKGEAERTGVLFEIFGQRAGPAMAALIGQGSLELEKMYKNFENIKGVTGDVAEDQLANLYGAFVKLKSAAAGFLIELGEPFLKVIAKIAITIRDAIASITEFISSFDKTTSAIVGIIAVFGALIASIGSVALVIGSLISTYALLQRTLQQFNTQAEVATANMVNMGAAANASNVAAGNLAKTWQSKLVSGAGRLLGAIGLLTIAYASFSYLMSELDKISTSVGTTMGDEVRAKAISLLEAFTTLKGQTQILTDFLNICTFGLLKQAIGFKNAKSAGTEYLEALRAAAQGEAAYIAKIPEFLAKARERLNINLSEIKTIKDLEKERDDALKNYDYWAEKELELLRKRVEEGRITKDELDKQEKELKDVRVAYLEEIKDATIRINAELVGGMGNLYENLLATIEKGSKEWFDLESQTIDALKAKNASMFEERKRLYGEGLISSKDFNEQTLKDLEDVYNRERYLLKERIKQKKLFNAEDAIGLKDLKNQMIALDRNYNEEVLNIVREGNKQRQDERKKDFDSWKTLQESRLNVVTKERDLELTQLKIARDKGLIGEEDYLRKELDLVKRNNEDRLSILDRAQEEEIAQNEEKLEEIQRQEFKLNREIKNINNDRVENTKVIRELISKLEAEGNQKDISYLKESLAEQEKAYNQRLILAKSSLKKIQDEKDKIYADDEKTANDRIALEKEMEEQYIQSEENIKNAQDERAKASQKGADDEKKAQEKVLEAHAAAFIEIAKGVIRYRELRAEAEQLTGVSSTLVGIFEEFKDVLTLGKIEADALEAAMSGSADQMLRAANYLEEFALSAREFDEGTALITRSLELLRAAQELRAEASRKQAIADREAALALERLTLTTQEYLGIATSAQSAISTFSSNIEDLTFGLENGLINQKAFNESVSELTEKLKIAVPENTELYRSIIELLNSLKFGKITIDFFTSALSEMTRAGFDASEGMEALADELAGHSVTTAAESAAYYIGMFSNALARGNEIVYRGIKGLNQYSTSVGETMKDASDKVGGLISKIGSIPKNIPKISFGGISDSLTNLSKIRIQAPRTAFAEGAMSGGGDMKIKIDASINSLYPEEAEVFARKYVVPYVFKALRNKGFKVD